MKIYFEKWINPKTLEEQNLEVTEYSFDDWVNGKVSSAINPGKEVLYNVIEKKHRAYYFPIEEYKKMCIARETLYWEKVNSQCEALKKIFNNTMERSGNKKLLLKTEIDKTYKLLIENKLYEKLVVRGNREFKHTNSPSFQFGVGSGDYEYIKVESYAKYHDWLNDFPDTQLSPSIKNSKDESLKIPNLKYNGFTLPKSIYKYLCSFGHERSYYVEKGKERVYGDLLPPLKTKFIFKDENIRYECFILEKYFDSFKYSLDKGDIFDEKGNVLDSKSVYKYLVSYAKGFNKGYIEFSDNVSKTELFERSNEDIAYKIFERVCSPMEQKIGNISVCKINFKDSKHTRFITSDLFYETGYEGGEFFKAWELILKTPLLFKNLFDEVENQRKERATEREVKKNDVSEELQNANKIAMELIGLTGKQNEPKTIQPVFHYINDVLKKYKITPLEAKDIVLQMKGSFSPDWNKNVIPFIIDQLGLLTPQQISSEEILPIVNPNYNTKIFTSYRGFQIFNSFKENIPFKENPNSEYSDYSFLFNNLKKDGFIHDLKHKKFIDYLYEEFDVKINYIQFNSSTTQEKKNRYSICKKEIK